MRPVIGIGGTPIGPIKQLANNPVTYTPQGYLDAISASGGIPLVLNPRDPKEINELVMRLDGFMLTGGQDVSPLFYGEEPHQKLGTTNYQRDLYELTLTKAALAANKPILGICRGMQIINVALGGTLYQDLGEKADLAVKHQQFPTDWNQPTHSLQFCDNTPLHQLFGDSTLVNSFHHEAIKDLAAGWQAIATSKDGVIEATYNQSAKLLGVQWHPERLFPTHPEHLGIFKWVVDQAANNQ